jgi:hypothetical protein
LELECQRVWQRIVTNGRRQGVILPWYVAINVAGRASAATVIALASAFTWVLIALGLVAIDGYGGARPVATSALSPAALIAWVSNGVSIEL